MRDLAPLGAMPVTWCPDDPFPASAALGETESGARNLPRFLCSMLRPGPTLVLGSSEVVLRAAEDRPVIVLDHNRRRLTCLEKTCRGSGLDVRFICRDPERQDLGLPGRSVANVLCADGLERFRNDVAVLDKLHRVLAPEGRLIVRVRTRNTVSSVRTYTPRDLRTALERAGFRAQSVRYWNLLGVPCAYVAGRSGGQATDRASVRHWWDDALDMWFRAVENRVGFPAGVSLVAVATPHLEKVNVRRTVLGPGGPARRGAREAYEPTALSS